MKIDTNRFKEFINVSFPANKVDITEYNSGVIVIDIVRAEDFIAIQYDGESYIGVSVIPDNTPRRAASRGLPNKVFYTIKEFEDYIEKMIK